MPKHPLDTSHYLGDGVYASFDGYQIQLFTERDGRSECIYLDSATFNALLQFQKKILEHNRSLHAQSS